MFSTKDTRNHKEHKRIGRIRDWKVWGAAPRPGREKFSLHPRHVCDVPEGDAKAHRRFKRCRRAPAGEGRQGRPENGEQRTERPCGATDGAA